MTVCSGTPCCWLLVAGFLAMPGHLPAQPSPPRDPNPLLTETIGLLLGSQLYQTYLNIGVLADAKTEGLYEEKDVRQLLQSVMQPLERIDQQLTRLTKSGLPRADVDALERSRKTLNLLHQQMTELLKYWDTGKSEHAERYEAARREAWKQISGLLHLEKDNASAPSPREVKPKK